MLTRVECRGSRQPGLLCLRGIKLSEAGSDLLAGSDGLSRELDGFVRVGCLNRNRFAPLNRDEQGC